jgi:hypothetical protein
MRVHFAIYQWKDGTPPERVMAALTAVKTLERVIDGIEAIYVGENTAVEGRGYTHAIVLVARDLEAVQAYRDHPDHQAYVAEVNDMKLDAIGIGFEDVAA